MKQATGILAVLLVAGCFGGTETASDGEPTPSFTLSGTGCEDCLADNPPEANLVSESLELFDCTTYFLQVPVKPEAFNSAPAGYTPSSTPPLIGLDAYVCPRGAIGNTTAIAEFSWFQIAAAVTPPDDQDNAGGRDVFLFESCMDSADVRALFARHGLATCDGAVTLDVSGQAISLTYRASGGATYTFDGAGEADAANPSTPATIRFHQSSESPTWFDQDLQPNYASPPGEIGIVQASGGFLGANLLVPDRTAARGGLGAATMKITFQNQEESVTIRETR